MRGWTVAVVTAAMLVGMEARAFQPYFPGESSPEVAELRAKLAAQEAHLARLEEEATLYEEAEALGVTAAVEASRHGPSVRIVGHPFIDVWQCVTPRAMGIAAWPEVPRGIEFKVGVCRALGWPERDQADIARAWQRILGRVSSYRDLEPALLGRVEELIDFVTEPAH